MNLSGNTQDAVLMALKKCPAGLTMPQILAETNLAHGWVSMAISNLWATGYIEKHNGAYRLTESGRNHTALWPTP